MKNANPRKIQIITLCVSSIILILVFGSLLVKMINDNSSDENDRGLLKNTHAKELHLKDDVKKDLISTNKSSSNNDRIYYFFDMWCLDCKKFFTDHLDIIEDDHNVGVSHSYVPSPVLGGQSNEFGYMQYLIDKNKDFEASDKFVHDALINKPDQKDPRDLAPSQKLIDDYEESKNKASSKANKLRKQLNISGTPSIIYETDGKFYEVKNKDEFMKNLKHDEDNN